MSSEQMTTFGSLRSTTGVEAAAQAASAETVTPESPPMPAQQVCGSALAACVYADVLHMSVLVEEGEAPAVVSLAVVALAVVALAVLQVPAARVGEEEVDAEEVEDVCAAACSALSKVAWEEVEGDS
jgi:hypothetical protein